MGCTIRCNIRMLQNHDYETVGQMLATMIVQGGERPCLFSQAVCDYLSKGLDGSKPTIDEVQDHAIRNDLKKVWYILILPVFCMIIGSCADVNQYAKKMESLTMVANSSTKNN